MTTERGREASQRWAPYTDLAMAAIDEVSQHVEAGRRWWSRLPSWCAWLPIGLVALGSAGVALFSWGPDHQVVTTGAPVSVQLTIHPWSYVLNLFYPRLTLRPPQLSWLNTNVPWSWLYRVFVTGVPLAEWLAVCLVVVWFVRREVAIVRALPVEEASG